jgi:hypothetical protein
MLKLFTKRMTISILLSIGLVACTLLNVSCSSLPHQEVKIRDGKWYGIKGKLGAHWFHTLSDSSGDITKDEWDKISFGMVATDSKNFASWSATIQKLCDSCNCCNRDPVNDLLAFIGRVKRTLQREVSHSDVLIAGR